MVWPAVVLDIHQIEIYWHYRVKAGWCRETRLLEAPPPPRGGNDDLCGARPHVQCLPSAHPGRRSVLDAALPGQHDAGPQAATGTRTRTSARTQAEAQATEAVAPRVYEQHPDHGGPGRRRESSRAGAPGTAA